MREVTRLFPETKAGFKQRKEHDEYSYNDQKEIEVSARALDVLTQNHVCEVNARFIEVSVR